MIAISNSTIQEYHALCDLTKDGNTGRLEVPTESWEEDKKKLLELLQNGKKVSFARIQRLVLEVKNDEVDPSSESWYHETSDYFKGRYPENTSIANTLQYAAKGVRKMAKAVPENDC
jgi:hypothetical protein